MVVGGYVGRDVKQDINLPAVSCSSGGEPVAFSSKTILINRSFYLLVPIRVAREFSLKPGSSCEVSLRPAAVVRS